MYFCNKNSDLVLTGNSLGQQLEKDKLLFRTYDANADGELDVHEQKLIVLVLVTLLTRLINKLIIS